MPKDYEEFLQTLEDDVSGKNWPEVLKSLWYDAKGDWYTAHKIVDGMSGNTAKWVHAYLHRKEGDEWNAGYWYRQAEKSFPKITLEEEHQELVEFILNQ